LLNHEIINEIEVQFIQLSSYKYFIDWFIFISKIFCLCTWNFSSSARYNFIMTWNRWLILIMQYFRIELIYEKH